MPTMPERCTSGFHQSAGIASTKREAPSSDPRVGAGKRGGGGAGGGRGKEGGGRGMEGKGEEGGGEGEWQRNGEGEKRGGERRMDLTPQEKTKEGHLLRRYSQYTDTRF